MSRVLRFGLTLVIVGVALTAVAFPPARATNVSLALFGSQGSGWGTSLSTESNPGPSLTVAQGDLVTITLHSTDGFSHEFLLDLNGNGAQDPGEPVSNPFTSAAQLTFSASQAGSFRYLCLFHPSTMRGTLVVHSTGSPGSAPPSTAPGDNGFPIVAIAAGLIVVTGLGAATLVLRRRH